MTKGLGDVKEKAVEVVEVTEEAVLTTSDVEKIDDKKPEPKKEIVASTGKLGEISNREHLELAALKIFQAKKCPDSYTSSRDVSIALHSLYSVGYRSFGEFCLALKNTYVLAGSVHFFSDLPLNIIMKSGKMEWFEEFFVDDKGIKISYGNENLNSRWQSAVFRVKRRDRDEIHEHSISCQDLINSGLVYDEVNHNFSEKEGRKTIWRFNSKIMVQRKARAKAFKFTFPDVLGGHSIDEYDRPREREYDKKNLKSESSFKDVGKEDEEKNKKLLEEMNNDS